MRRIILALLIITSLAPVIGSQISDEEILQKADDARFLQADSFVMTIKVVAERPAEGKITIQEAVLKIFIKRFGEDIRQRVEFLEPESMRGTIYLVVGDDIYFYQEGLMQPLRISGQQRLFGDAGVAEAAGITFADKYEIKSKEDVSIEGKEALLLELRAKSPKTAYQIISLWVEKESFRPLQAVLYALSEEPLKRVSYQKYEELEGDELVTEMLVEDLLIKDHRTMIQITEILIQELPDELFDPEALGKE